MLDIASHTNGYVKEGVLSEEEIKALDALFKRFGFSEAKSLSTNTDEARAMLLALSKVQEIISSLPEVLH